METPRYIPQLSSLGMALCLVSGSPNVAAAWDIESAKTLYAELGKNSTAYSLLYTGLLSGHLCPTGTAMMKLDGRLQVKIIKLDNGKQVAFPNVSFRVNKSKFFTRWYDTEKISFKYQNGRYKIGPIKCFNKDGKEINFKETESDQSLEKQALYGLLLNQSALYVMLNSDRIVKYYGKKEILNVYSRLVVWQRNSKNTTEKNQPETKEDNTFYKAVQVALSVGSPIDKLSYNPNQEQTKYARLNYVDTVCYNKNEQFGFAVTRHALPPSDLKRVTVNPICTHKNSPTTVIKSKDNKIIPLPKPRPKDLITIDPAKDPADN